MQEAGTAASAAALSSYHTSANSPHTHHPQATSAHNHHAAAAHHSALQMDLHMAAAASAQPFSYYSFMDNGSMFAAQQVNPYGRMYATGLENGGVRPREEIAQQGTINTRVLELRKEKSRDAARSRRGKENYEFYELAKMLPLPSAITSQLDKASIIRLTIAYLRLRDFAKAAEPNWEINQKTKNSLRTSNTTRMAMEIFEEHEGTHILQSLDGFAISLNSDGRFLYISETVSIYLGLSQVEMTGSSFFDYVHQADHQELAEQLGVTLAGSSSHRMDHSDPRSPNGGSNGHGHGGGGGAAGALPAIPDVCYPVTSLMYARSERMSGRPSYERAFCIRMKSTLTKRGCHFKSSGYRVVLLVGKLRPQTSNSASSSSSKGKTGGSASSLTSSLSNSNSGNTSTILGFIGLAIALPPPSVHEVRLESDMFVTRLTFDFKIAHCEPKVTELVDYTADDLVGQSMYALCHAEDVHKIRKMHEDLLNKGQVMSTYFRLMNKSGGYTWMQSCATLICNTKNSDEQSIICVNYVLSGPQYADIVMNENQLNLDSATDSKANIIKEDCDFNNLQGKGDYNSSQTNCQDSSGNNGSQTNNGPPPGKKAKRRHTQTQQQPQQPQSQQTSLHNMEQYDDNNHNRLDLLPATSPSEQQNQQLQQHQMQQHHLAAMTAASAAAAAASAATAGSPSVNPTNHKEWPFWRPPTLI